MEKSKMAIVVITYNRVNCFIRLLTRLLECEYSEKVDLIISIDKSNSSSILDYSKDFHWPFGNVIIKAYEENLGLRKHVLNCGNYASDYDAIIVFEDDIFPSKYFYQYSKEAVEFYADDHRIAGISLYQHRWNTNINLDFIPEIDSNVSNYFMQFAQSWGQVWTKGQWNEFYTWYLNNDEEFHEEIGIPDDISHYPKSSWLKYFIKYVIKNNKYFVYPNISLTTNFSDAGTHNQSSSPHYQVPIQNQKISKYNFVALNDAKIIYDGFYERKNIGEYLKLPEKELCIDLYGDKRNKSKKRYFLTQEKLNFKIISSYGLNLKPIESNIINQIQGEDIFLYDTTCVVNNEFKKNNLEEQKLFYSNRDIKIGQLFKMTYFISLQKSKIIVSKLLRKVSNK